MELDHIFKTMVTSVGTSRFSSRTCLQYVHVKMHVDAFLFMHFPQKTEQFSKETTMVFGVVHLSLLFKYF